MIKNNREVKRIAMIIVLVLIAVLSVTVVSEYATSPEFHKSTIKELDEKKMTALGLTATVTATSAAISAIPGDVATPIAEKLSDLTTPLLIVVCAIYFEKFLLTSLGYISFDILVPLSCLLLCGYVLLKKDTLKTLAIKLIIFALSIFLIIPASVKVSHLMEQTFNDSISKTMDEVKEFDTPDQEMNSTASKNWWDKILDAADIVVKKVSELPEKAKKALSIFIDAVAVLVITTCIIPIAVVFFFIWIIKLLFGLNLDTSQVKNLLSRKKEV